MSIVVFWIQPGSGEGMFPNMSQPNARTFKDTELQEALAYAATLRRENLARHVCISSEFPDNVTKPGVDSVEGGRTPDGQEYSWRKRR